MRIGLFAAFAGRNCGGPEVYERELIRAMAKRTDDHHFHVYCLDQRAPDTIGPLPENFTYHVLRPAYRVISMLTGLPSTVARTKPDVFHAMMIPPPFFPVDPRKTIVALPCSALARRPEFYPLLIRLRLKFLLNRAIPKAGVTICFSQHIRDVVIEDFKVPGDRLPVIYPGVNQNFHPIDDEEQRTAVARRYGLDLPYFLFSGRWEQRKNVVGILEGYARFRREHRTDHTLVFTGERTWAARDAEAAIQRLGLTDAIVDLGKTPIDELPLLYGAADALVYVSLWEGFGMPIIEAMACGTPVIASDVSGMPETAGNAALLVDPQSPEAIASAMHRIATDPDLRRQLSRNGRERAPMFSWERAVEQLFEVYERLSRVN